MKTFRHSGKCGDIIFSLPTIKALGGGILYIPQNTPDQCSGMYDNMKELLLQQPCIHEVREYPSGLAYGQRAAGIHIDYDLDDARNQPAKGVIHIVKRYLDAFGITLHNWKEPWLLVDEPMPGDYSIINYTGRHIVNSQTGAKSRVNWKQVVAGIEGQVYFVGTPQEYKWFAANIAPVSYLPTTTMLGLARVVAGAKKVYCNQSSVLALAQSVGIRYWLDVKPGKQNCLLFTSIEHAL
jgi:hypothetical protein